MATTENLHNGTGSQDTFPFTFPYLKDTDIKVSVGGILKTVTTHYTLHTPTTIKFTSGNIPASGTSNVRVYRETADTALQATFYPGSAIRSNDLNDNFTQNLYVIQENNNRVDSAWQTGDETIISTEVWHISDDTRIASTKAIENRIAAQIDTAIEGDVLAGTDLAKTQSGGRVTLNHSVSGANSTVNNSNGTVLQDITISAQGHVTSVGSYDLDNRYYTETELNAGQLDNRYYTETELDAGQLDNRYFTETELTTGGAIDSRYYTETELNAGQLDNRYFTETELTNGALDGRYFTETEADNRYFNISSGDTIKDGDAFPDNDTSIATTAAINDRIVDLLDDVGGFVPIANETSFPNANPDINNGAGTLVSIKALSSNLTSNGSGVATIANGTVGNSTITITGLENSTTYGATLGMILETTSTLNTYAFHRVTPKATEVTTVASNISNVNAAANNSSNINAAVANASNINAAVANATNINSAVSNASNINTVAGIDGNVTTVAGISANVTTVAGISSNVTTVAGVSANVTTVAGISSDVTAVANDATDIGAVAGKATEIGRLGTADAVSDLNTLGTAAIVTDLDTCATNVSSINTVSGSISNVNTVATNIASVNNFSDQYRISSSQPSTHLHEGDLYFDTTNNELRVYNGSSWQGGVTATGNLVSKADIGAASGVPGSGSNGQYLRTNGSGTLNWETIQDVVLENDKIIADNYTITTGKHGSSVGPVAVAANKTLTIPANTTYLVH